MEGDYPLEQSRFALKISTMVDFDIGGGVRRKSMLAGYKRVKSIVTGALAHPVEQTAHEQVRLRLLGVVAILKLFNYIGWAWDIQRRVAIGRDSLFIPPLRRSACRSAISASAWR
jgi:hypothetical protein